MRGPRKLLTLGRVLGLGGAFLVLLGAVFVLTLFLGERSISPGMLWWKPEAQELIIFWKVRLPHAVLAALVGAGLAASGATLQGVMRNPLADPFVLGVSGGAALGATLALALGFATVEQVVPGLGGELRRVSAPALFSFAGAAAATAFVLAIGRNHGRRVPYAALLTGVIFNSFASAAITLLKVLSAPDRLREILFWLVGTLGEERPGTLVLSALLQVVAVGVMVALSGRLNLLLLGDEDAASLGVAVERTRWTLLLAASASVAGAVALSGLIGFVGLLVPHLLRLLLGPDQRLLVPLSALGGAAYLLLADMLARMATPLAGESLPVGAVTALLGGPLFLALLYRRGRLAGA